MEIKPAELRRGVFRVRHLDHEGPHKDALEYYLAVPSDKLLVNSMRLYPRDDTNRFAARRVIYFRNMPTPSDISQAI